MDSTSELPQQIIEALERSRIVLTANQRAARSLSHAFDLRQHSLGKKYWEPPPVLAWDAWLDAQWGRLLMDGAANELLLNSTQEQTIWRAVIRSDAEVASLRPIEALAQTAADAWLRLHQFRGRHRLEQFPGNSDTRAFARWATEFERRCARAQYLTEAQLIERLRAAFASGELTMPGGAGLFLVGFDSKTPAQISLLDALRETGIAIEEFDQPVPSPNLIVADAPDEYCELTACARWLRTRLAEQGGSSIAVVVPSMEMCRAELDRVFRQILAPELNDIASPPGTGPYELSLGVPLAHAPIAATALDILHWASAPLPLERLSAVLLSPHFATESAKTELNARAEFDAFVLRDQHLLQPVMSLDNLFRLTSDTRYGRGLPVLNLHLRALRPMLNSADSAPAKRTHADWTALIHDILEAAGWAAISYLDSIEFQTRRKWESALDELTTLDFDGTRVTFADALAALERIATETLFAPESRHAPVQVMGPLESAGSAFDAVWFLCANDLAWPSRPAPNPLLPWLLQRELAMPGIDPARDAGLARRITERIASSAPTVVFSYGRANADGPQRLSPAVAGLRLQTQSIDTIAPTEVQSPRIQLETRDDNDPLPPPPDSALRGGASILQAQAACGFRAFAEKRLFSSAPATIELGLDASERGSLVHRVLELFWTETRTQKALREMARTDRDSLLTRSIATALQEKHRQVDPGWPHAYFATERRRLFRLLDAWLNLELTRPAFEVKAMEEQLYNAPIGPLHLEVRVDRVDTSLLGGEPAGEIILDYKTGTVAPADWLGERPDEPQLPLYAVLSQPAQIAAVAFANVRPGEEQPLKGYESRKGVLTRAAKLRTDSLDAQIESWRKVLSVLAQDFHDGEASVAPKQYPSTCRYCEQRILCRLNLDGLAADANEDFVDASDPTVDTLEPIAEVERV